VASQEREKKMNYILLMRDENSGFSKLGESEMEKIFGQFVGWTEGLHKQGKLKGVEKLNDDGGKTLRRKKNSFVVDGPYSEAKEAIAGYYIVEAKDEVEALEIAKGCPILLIDGSIEVRAVDPFPKPQ
jgi:hypothetical protein